MQRSPSNGLCIYIYVYYVYVYIIYIYFYSIIYIYIYSLIYYRGLGSRESLRIGSVRLIGYRILPSGPQAQSLLQSGA